MSAFWPGAPSPWKNLQSTAQPRSYKPM
ncbi:UNVERIFIED_CONTAM: hypothetical protein GTU68_018525 [Idotea baltica]|nr:hypothetical protein [Idotea baltica]